MGLFGDKNKKCCKNCYWYTGDFIGDSRCMRMTKKTWLGNVEYVKVSSSGCCDYFNNKNGSSDKDNSGYHE